MTKRQKKNLYRILIAVVLMVILHFVPLEGAAKGVLYLIPYLVGWKRATVATLVYILLGTAGVPVFRNFGA